MPADDDITLLKAKIAALETQARRQRVLLGTLVLGAVGVFIAGQTASRPSRVLRANSIVIENEKGEECAVLDESGLCVGHGDVTARLDRTGLSTRVTLTAEKKSVVCQVAFNGLRVTDPDGRFARLSVPLESEYGGLELADVTGDCRVNLNLGRDGAPAIVLKRSRDPAVRDYFAKLFRDPQRRLEPVPDVIAEAMRCENAMVIGATSLVDESTDVREVRPEASIVIFNPKGRVSYKIP